MTPNDILVCSCTLFNRSDEASRAKKDDTRSWTREHSSGSVNGETGKSGNDDGDFCRVPFGTTPFTRWILGSDGSIAVLPDGRHATRSIESVDRWDGGV